MQTGLGKGSEFSGRVAVIATMHGKEQVIAPLLKAALGVEPRVPQTFNTDAFGTFSREIQRPADQRTTARLKAAAALEATGETLAIASEGSFGPHPELPFMPCDRELVLLLDRQQQLEIVGETISSDTNYRSQTIRTVAEAQAFAQAVGFPQHGLIVMATATGEPAASITKGITTEAALREAVLRAQYHSATGGIHIETDMRACYNPSRMTVIAQATRELLQAIEHRCPQCHCPGFRVIQRQPGLPCRLCRTPTLLTRALLYRCQRCQFQQAEAMATSQSLADPTFCPYCNP